MARRKAAAARPAKVVPGGRAPLAGGVAIRVAVTPAKVGGRVPAGIKVVAAVGANRLVRAAVVAVAAIGDAARAMAETAPGRPAKCLQGLKACRAMLSRRLFV